MAFSEVHLLLRIRLYSALVGPLDGRNVVALVESHEVEVVAHRVVSKHFRIFEELIAFSSLGQAHSPGCEVSRERFVLGEVGWDDSLRREPCQRAKQ